MESAHRYVRIRILLNVPRILCTLVQLLQKLSATTDTSWFAPIIKLVTWDCWGSWQNHYNLSDGLRTSYTHTDISFTLLETVSVVTPSRLLPVSTQTPPCLHPESILTPPWLRSDSSLAPPWLRHNPVHDLMLWNGHFSSSQISQFVAEFDTFCYHTAFVSRRCLLRVALL